MEGLFPNDGRRNDKQMITDDFRLDGQLKLQRAAIAVVGAGGLGCPSLQYLALAGVGKIAIFDHDTVELSNLQRQILHSERTVGLHKTESAAQAIRKLNCRVRVEAVSQPLHPANAIQLLGPYDVILDCTDNAPTRYLLNDTAVRLRKPLVSGAAQRYYGQVCTYNLGENGLCYRCLFPNPPPVAETCEETGILGVVTGVIGTLQALEAIKIIVGLHDMKPYLLTYSILNSPPFHAIKLPLKSPSCPACGKESDRVGEIRDIDYVQFCGGPTPDWEREGMVDARPEWRIRVKDLKNLMDTGRPLNIIDVRSETEFGICHLPNSRNAPLEKIRSNPGMYIPQSENVETYVMCRLGNDSQVAANILREHVVSTQSRKLVVKDVVGGLRAWARDVNVMFPIY